jgi:hypothetical protein
MEIEPAADEKASRAERRRLDGPLIGYLAMAAALLVMFIV